MITKTKRIVPEYYIDSRVSKCLIMGEKIFLSCLKDFNLFIDYERFLYQILPIDLYTKYIDIMSLKLENYTSKFEDYSQFIIDNIEDSDDINSN